MSGNKPTGNKPATGAPSGNFIIGCAGLGDTPMYIEDTVSNRFKFGGILPVSPESRSQGLPTDVPSPEQSEDDVNASMLPSSPPTSPIRSPIQAGSESAGASNWYCPEKWPEHKVKEQETRASRLLGDNNRIKATLEYYCAHDLQHHSKWVRILVDHIILFAEARGQELNTAVAYHVSQSRASKYRQKLEASILESETKRAVEEEAGANKKGSLRGKSKIARTDDASISKGTHPLSKKGSARKSIPAEMMPDDSSSDDQNFKLIGPDDFLKTLKLPKQAEEQYFESFRQLRDVIFRSLRAPGTPYDPLFFVCQSDDAEDTDSTQVVPFDGQREDLPIQRHPMEPSENLENHKMDQDCDRMDVDVSKIPGYLNSDEKCTVQ
ncbi:hypothetical protein TWF730_008501 [Orbilia blumenaviensis]|uniref:Uncharacterized protein n=1 Tax=Orbilia blumenaviensis TaxID=1796055 RepID=A0AAV9V459_9PEZI